jgi:hypothetical protein
MSTKRSRLRRISFTINNPTEDDHSQLLDLYYGGIFKFLIYQEEEGSDNHTRHVQGYGEFVRQLEFKAIKILLPDGAHIECSRGSKQQNISYCSKSSTRLSGPFVYGDAVSGQGQRTDLLVSLQVLSKSCSLQEAVNDEDFALTFLKYSSGFTRLAQLKGISTYSPTPPEQKEVIVVWGTTGTGKTHTAYTDLCSKYPERQPWFCVDLSGRWFDGYTCQPGVIFDDFRGAKSDLKVDQFLRLTDKWPMQVPIKGSFAVWQPKTIYITSNEDPAEWYYNESAATQDAVSRRLTRIICLTQPFTG